MTFRGKVGGVRRPWERSEDIAIAIADASASDLAREVCARDAGLPPTPQLRVVPDARLLDEAARRVTTRQMGDAKRWLRRLLDGDR